MPPPPGIAMNTKRSVHDGSLIWRSSQGLTKTGPGSVRHLAGGFDRDAPGQ
jgi:hypothetical protein